MAVERMTKFIGVPVTPTMRRLVQAEAKRQRRTNADLVRFILAQALGQTGDNDNETAQCEVDDFAKWASNRLV